jgi:hypothetical protein
MLGILVPLILMYQTLFDLNSVTGLSEQEAIAILKQDGYNELPSAEARNFLAIVG